MSSVILPMWFKCVHSLARTTALWDMSGTYRRKYLLYILYLLYVLYIHYMPQDEMNCCNLNLIPCTCFCFHFDWKQTQAQLINCPAVSASAVLHCYAELFLSGHQPAELHILLSINLSSSEFNQIKASNEGSSSSFVVFIIPLFALLWTKHQVVEYL